MKTITGKFLNKFYGLDASHYRYRRNGVWYHPLRSFPGVLFDGKGYILFKTEKDYIDNNQVKKGPDPNHIHVKEGIKSIQGYVELDPSPESLRLD